MTNSTLSSQRPSQLTLTREPTFPSRFEVLFDDDEKLRPALVISSKAKYAKAAKPHSWRNDLSIFFTVCFRIYTAWHIL